MPFTYRSEKYPNIKQEEDMQIERINKCGTMPRTAESGKGTCSFYYSCECVSLKLFQKKKKG